ncbi:MAG TPA: hypothetical protein VGN28_04015 [Blastococcus sp.]|nr:hypothetical protein [Blastococcus sp.]
MSTALVVSAAATPENQAGPERNRLGVALLVFSAAGLPLGRLAARRLGGWGDLLVESGCAMLFARDLTMTFGGAPARLRPLPRALLLLELVASGTAVPAISICDRLSRPLARPRRTSRRTFRGRWMDIGWPLSADVNGQSG